jgi:hypothetical protein
MRPYGFGEVGPAVFVKPFNVNIAWCQALPECLRDVFTFALGVECRQVGRADADPQGPQRERDTRR